MPELGLNSRQHIERFEVTLPASGDPATVFSPPLASGVWYVTVMAADGRGCLSGTYISLPGADPGYVNQLASFGANLTDATVGRDILASTDAAEDLPCIVTIVRLN